MNRCDFSSISTCLKNHISESNQMSQPDFLYELFEDFMDDPTNQDFSMDNGLVCRWMTGQAKISPKISAYYSKPSNHENLAHTIAGIGKSELAKAYTKRYMRHYTNILYVEYTGNLHQDITDIDFIDDLPESIEQERFQRHNRFLRSLKSDTLLIIDNFNVTATQDSFLSVVLKYRCQILFTTRSKLDEYCTLPLKEISDMNALFQLASVFYSEADKYRATCIFLFSSITGIPRVILLMPE